MQINSNTILTDPALDAAVKTADDAAHEARRVYAVTLAKRLEAQLRAVFPAGGTLHLESWSEVGETCVDITGISDPNGVRYTDAAGNDDPATVMGEDAYQVVLDDVRALHDAGIFVLYFKYGTATFPF